MTVSISFRPSDEDVRNLAVLEQCGLTRTEAIRGALRESAQRRRQSVAIRAEVEALRDDPVDCAAVQDIRDFFGEPWEGLAR